MTEPTPPPPPHRVERILAYMIAAVVGVALIALVVLLISAAAGMSGLDYAEGIWPLVAVLPLIGFPIGVLLILAYLIATTVRRARGAQSGTTR